MNERNIDLGLDISLADAERIAGLVKQGIYVQRSIMQGESYTSVTWSFTPSDDEDGDDEPEPDSLLQELLARSGM